jgi:O-antigen/teichoic acid export membrane protein
LANYKLGARLLNNTAILLATQVITKFLGTVFTIVIARELGVADYGLWVFATSLGYVFGMLVAFGFPRLIAREVARDLGRTSDILGRILGLEVVFSSLAMVALAVTLFALHYPPGRAWIIGIGGAAMVLNGVLDVTTAFFRAHQRMGLEGAVRITLSLLNVGLGLAVLFVGLGLPALAITQLVAFTLALLVSLFLIQRRLARPSFSTDWRVYRRLLVGAVPFALSGFFVYLYDGTSVLFLSAMRGDLETGLYSAATNFIRVFGILPASLVAAFLPAMALFSQTSPGEWNTLYRRSLKYLLIMAVPISVGLALVSDDIVSLVLGKAYADSAPILQLAAWVIIPVFLNSGCSNALISMNREKSLLRVVGLAMVFNLVSNPVLISRWGAYGAVGASLLTEGLILAILLNILRRAGAKLPVRELVVKPVLSAGLMAGAVSLGHRFGLLGMISLGAVVYVVALLTQRTFDVEELGSLRMWWALACAKLPGGLRQQPR